MILRLISLWQNVKISDIGTKIPIHQSFYSWILKNVVFIHFDFVNSQYRPIILPSRMGVPYDNVFK